MSIMAACTLRVAFQSWLLLAICLAHNHHVASRASSVFMSEEDAEEEMQKIEQLDEQAEMVPTPTHLEFSQLALTFDCSWLCTPIKRSVISQMS